MKIFCNKNDYKSSLKVVFTEYIKIGTDNPSYSGGQGIRTLFKCHLLEKDFFCDGI